MIGACKELDRVLGNLGSYIFAGDVPVTYTAIAYMPVAYMPIVIRPSRVQMVVVGVFRVVVIASVDPLLAVETHSAAFWVLQRRFSCIVLLFAGV